MTTQIVIGIVGIAVTIGIFICGYILSGMNTRIDANAKAALSMHESAKQATRDAEARCMSQIKDTETRAEKGDERVLSHLNSQYAELQRSIREIRALLAEQRNHG